MKFLNYTPHEINVVLNDGTTKTFPSVGIARVQQENILKNTINNINVYESNFGEVEGLPPIKDDTYIIVSALVKSACCNRDDLVSPGELIRDENGNIIGCRGFIH